MVKLAEEKEAEERLGCKFIVHDILTLSIPNQLFDAVVGVFVFNHARNFEELKTFCRVDSQHLKPGGRFVGLNENPFDKPEYFASNRSYGIVKHGNTEREGNGIWIEFINHNRSSCKVLNFYFPSERYVEAFIKRLHLSISNGTITHCHYRKTQTRKEASGKRFWTILLA